MPPRLGYGTGMGNSDMLRGGNGIGVPRPKLSPLPTLGGSHHVLEGGHHFGREAILESFFWRGDF